MRRRYDTGGLAEAVGVTPPPDDDEDLSGLSAVSSGGGNGPSPSLRENLERSRRLNSMTYETAIARLQEGRKALLAQKSTDDSAKWLALAQGMLAPTKTGGFGESAGNAAGLIRQQMELNTRSTLDRQQLQQDYDKQEAAADAGYAERDIDILGREAAVESGIPRARVIGSYNANVPRGAQAEQLGLDPNVDHVVRIDSMLMPDGTTKRQISQVDGLTLDVAATTNPETVRATTRAAEETKGGVDIVQKDVDKALGAMVMAPKMREARSILSKVKANGGTTSGMKNDLLRLTEYLGVTAETIPEGTDLLTMQSKVGQAVLNQLMQLSGSKSDLEYRKTEEQFSRMGTNVDTNMKILDDMISNYDHLISEGTAATAGIKDPEYRDYVRAKLQRYKDDQSKASTAATATRTPPSEAVSRLLDRIGTAKDQKAELDSFRKHFDIPDELKIELRKRGVAI